MCSRSFTCELLAGTCAGVCVLWMCWHTWPVLCTCISTMSHGEHWRQRFSTKKVTIPGRPFDDACRTYPFSQLGIHHEVVNMFLCACQLEFSCQNGYHRCCTGNALETGENKIGQARFKFSSAEIWEKQMIDFPIVSNGPRWNEKKVTREIYQ